ncbi:MBL fold metallo-hydrolase [Pyrobaculum ferrireducens]|uniref:Beta-lactamase domain protein n=1 Tax=Pyrobaculum ferrireducens TaxID=1104324 RepID=G7VH14_9CREN|nr:ribonuclease Z [Pyrobaculum ferrireducens]AET33185.1 beta-lactamase domain protein [Pyrobaculum ferrireducens]
MYLHILGSGAGGSPGSRRWRSANLLDTGEGLVVIDCGVGCHYRLSDRGLLAEVDYVLVTHSHMDHYLGLPETLFQAHIEGRRKPIHIFAPRVVEEAARLVAVNLFKAPSYQIHFHRLAPGTVVKQNTLVVEAGEACHHTAEEAYAFKISARGLDILFSGDTGPGCEPVERLGQGVELAVLEATCNEEYGEICRRYAHMTTFDAVREAEAMKVREVVLSHIDEKFNPTVYQDVKKLNRHVLVAEDNMVIHL